MTTVDGGKTVTFTSTLTVTRYYDKGFQGGISAENILC